MPSYKKIFNEVNFIFYQIPGGKPDPKAYVPPEEMVTKYVNRSAQKGKNCFYYALNLVRNKVGKAAEVQNLPERKIEIFFSEYRKKNGIYHSKRSSLKLLQETFKQFQNMSDRDIVKYINSCLDVTHEDFEFFKKTLDDFLRKDKTSFLPFIDAILEEENTTYAAYLINILNQNSIDYMYVFRNSQCGVDAGFDFQKLTSAVCCIFLNSCVNLLMAKQYNLTFNNWHPDQEFEVFMEQLKQDGPLVIAGVFGKDSYKNPPSVSKDKSLGHPINFWPKGSEKKEIWETHTIVVVGAKRDNGKALVYYVDPSVPSPAGDCSRTSIFCISYDNVKQNAWALGHGLYDLLDFTHSENDTLQNTYALAPPKKPQQLLAFLRL